MAENNTIVLMTGERAERSLKRIAYQVAEQNHENRPVLIFGINDRGYVVSRKLASYLDAIIDEGARSVQLKLDDKPAIKKTLESINEEKKKPFLVVADDVIFSGKTMFSTLREIDSILGLDEIYTVALVDRGHRKVPIEAEFTGMELPTKLNEEVRVIVEGDEVKEVVLTTHA